MIRLSSVLPLAALLFAAPLAAQAARDFQLPPGPAPTDSQVQGPVDTDGPVPVRPRAIETARPATAAPTSAPTTGAAPAIVLPTPSASRSAAAQTTPTRSVAVEAAPTLAPTLAPPLASPSAITPGPVTIPTATPTAAPAPPAQQPVQGLPWLWLALGGSVAAIAAGLLIWRRRRAVASTPQIVVPHVPTPHVSAALPGEALAIGVEAVRMDRSVLNATVGYRVTIRNRTSQALNGVAIEADLVSASRDRPADQQIAIPEQALTPRHATERLAPGQSLRFEGQVRLPLSEASAIWQGRVGLLVPLLRVRATAVGAAPVATTLVIGRAEGSTARPQPFRLDEPPRSYAPLAQRVLDAVPARA